MFNARARASVNRQTYIPPHVEQAMNQHMQATMPAHLKKYADGNAGYVPQHIQKEMSRYMEKSMPTHLKQYSGAYMQQRVTDPNTARLNPAASATAVTARSGTHPPVPNLMRRDHSVSGTSQHWVEQDTLPNATPLFQPEQKPEQHVAAQQPQSPTYPTQQIQPGAVMPPTPNAPGQNNYDFIMNPQAPIKQPRAPLSGNSLLKRAAIIGGGFVVLIILFSVIKGALTHNNFAQYANLAADQQELVHIATGATTSAQKNNLSASSQNFAYTAQLTLASAQAGVVTYLKDNHAGVSTKILNGKISTTTDQELSTAAANSTYDQTFQQVMQTKLQSYMQDLNTTKKTTTGPHGKALLNQDSNSAELLLEQLNTPSS